MRTVAVLPVKRFEAAKSRLGGAVDRAALAQAMVADVLDALAAVAQLDAVVVVTGDAAAADAACAAGAEVVAEPAQPGHSAAAAAGAAEAAGRADRVLMVPGDCPALDPGEVEALLAEAPPRSVTIVPDRHGTGTNALLLAPPLVMAPAFGPGSFARHAALARAANAAVRVARVPTLELDVDTPDDLAALGAFLQRHPGAAPRTRQVLGGLVVC